MSDWLSEVQELAALEPAARAALSRLNPMEVAKGACLFSPGEVVKGYVIVLTGHVGVHLVGPNGRDILLYEVKPGQSCIQSTLGLLGGDAYSAEALVSQATRLVLIPKPVFLELVDTSPAFRKVVFAAFADRMQSMMQLIETMSFLKVEARLAALILERAQDAHVVMTQAEMARAIGSAREVVSRRLDRLAKLGAIRAERGVVTVIDADLLERIVENPAV